jgi:TetR/AcrR family transcriptional repressor of lmrAB and yxaGH operons
VHASELVRRASARAFDSWCTAIGDRLRADGWPGAAAEETALAVVSIVEGALMLSRTIGDPRALQAAKAAAGSLLRA